MYLSCLGKTVETVRARGYSTRPLVLDPRRRFDHANRRQPVIGQFRASHFEDDLLELSMGVATQRKGYMGRIQAHEPGTTLSFLKN